MLTRYPVIIKNRKKQKGGISMKNPFRKEKHEKVKIYEPQKEKIQRIQQQIMIMNRVMTAC